MARALTMYSCETVMYLPCQLTILGVMLGAPLTSGTMQGRLSSSILTSSPSLSLSYKNHSIQADS